MKRTLLALALCLALTPRDADACTTDALDSGLTLQGPFPQVLPGGGVLAISAMVRGVSVDAAVADFGELRVSRDDLDLAGALEFVTVASGLGDDGLQLHEVIVVWRPQEPLVVGEQLDVLYTDGDGFDTTWSASVGAAAAPATLPEISPVARTVQIDGPERVCCELRADSCDLVSLCLPTSFRETAAMTLQGASLPDIKPQSYLWLARIDADGAREAPLLRPIDRDFEGTTWTTWLGPVVFTDRDAPYCVIAGVTSLVDGTTVESEPLCLTAEQVGPLETIEFDLDLPAVARGIFRECVSDPVYEADGSPYPRVASGGCRTAPTPGPAGLLLLALALLRRRRA